MKLRTKSPFYDVNPPIFSLNNLFHNSSCINQNPFWRSYLQYLHVASDNYAVWKAINTRRLVNFNGWLWNTNSLIEQTFLDAGLMMYSTYSIGKEEKEKILSLLICSCVPLWSHYFSWPLFLLSLSYMWKDLLVGVINVTTCRTPKSTDTPS